MVSLVKALGGNVALDSRGYWTKCKPMKASDELKLFMCITHENSGISYQEICDISDPNSNDNLISHIAILNSINRLLRIFELKYDVSQDLRFFVVCTDQKRNQFMKTRWNFSFIPEYTKRLQENNKIDQLLKIRNELDKHNFIAILLDYYNIIYKIYKGHLKHRKVDSLWRQLKEICKTAFFIFSLNLTLVYDDFLIQSMLGIRSKAQKKRVMNKFNDNLHYAINKAMKKIDIQKLNSRIMFDKFLIEIWKSDFNFVLKTKESQNFKHKLYSTRFTTFQDFAKHEEYPKKHSRYNFIREAILTAAHKIDYVLLEKFEDYFKTNRGFKLYSERG